MAYEGWSAYCAAKSGVERLTECVALEEKDHGLRAYSVAPGVVDTDMQARIRECTEAEFPEVERFRSLKRDGGFNTVPWVAEHLLRIAFDPGAAPESVAHRIPDEKA
jgi:benzil reductase ((S)-benzoin forming)